MAWIKVYQSLTTHRKTLHAADLLGLRPVHMVGHLVAFWLWALDNEPDGNLNGTSARIVAYAAQWDGDPAVFVDALLEAGLLSYDGNGNLVIHDWHDYAGKLIDRRETERERQRRVRSMLHQQTQDVPPTYAPRVEKSREDIHATHSANAPKKAPAAPVPQRLAFGKIVDNWGKPANDGEKGKYERAAKLFAQAGAIEEIATLKCEAEARQFPECTPLAVANNVSMLRHPRGSPPGPPVDFDQQRAKFRQELESPL